MFHGFRSVVKKDSRVGSSEASQVKGRPSNMFVKYRLKSNTAFARLSTIKAKGFVERLFKCLCAYWPRRLGLFVNAK